MSSQGSSPIRGRSSADNLRLSVRAVWSLARPLRDFLPSRPNSLDFVSTECLRPPTTARGSLGQMTGLRRPEPER